MAKEDIMKPESVLPADFDGTFRFTNWTDEEFVGVWGSKEYHFKALATSPMIIPDHSPLQIQYIRKKFARDLAEREFFKSKEFKLMTKQEGTPGNRTMTGIHQAATYSLTELAPYIQKCLEPLPVSQVLVKEGIKRDVESTLTRDSGGDLVTEAIDQKKSLRAKALSS